jgi:hypothetical protein
MTTIEIPQQTYIEVTLGIEGVKPMLMNAPTLIDPLHPLKLQLADITSKQKKTIADHERMARIEYAGHIYIDDELGPYIPTANIKKCLTDSATRWKLGKAVTRGVFFEDMKVALEYDGPRTTDELYDEGFVDVRPIKNSGMNAGRTMRTRPCFDQWSLTATFSMDPHEIGVDQMALVLERAQKLGLMDYRPEFGLFKTTMEVGS